MISFTKMQGLGNDFVVIDATGQPFLINKEQIRLMGNRHYGIGFDQLLIIEPAKDPNVDFNYRIFNADGTEVAQCGNGARCVARYIYESGLCSNRELVLKTVNSYLKVTIETKERILVDMGKPTFEPQEIPFRVEKKSSFYNIQLTTDSIRCAVVALGNPHAVIFLEDFMNISLPKLGAELNCHPQFPEGVNVGLVKVISPIAIQLQVYERGVGETLACGSGACAAAVVGKKLGLLAMDEAIKVSQQGGNLLIHWLGENASILMEGPAEFVFQGTWFESDENKYIDCYF